MGQGGEVMRFGRKVAKSGAGREVVKSEEAGWVRLGGAAGRRERVRDNAFHRVALSLRRWVGAAQ